MLGVVNLDKPVGPTSHDMVGLLRRLTGLRRIGHAGTLDPLASGVLPILVGGATRFSDELTGGAKRYTAVIRLGTRSETDDAQGPLVRGGVEPPDDTAIRTALAGLVGTFDQRPPAFSARKVGGRTAHRAARAGSPLDVPARRVTIDAIDILEIVRSEDGVDVEVDIRCGPGTYIRSVARDLGDTLRCGGYLAALRRTEAAGLHAADAHEPAALERLAADGRLSEVMLPVGPLLPLPRIDLDAAGAWRFVHGSTLPIPETTTGRAAVYDAGTLIGVGHVADGVLRPDKVVAAVTDA